MRTISPAGQYALKRSPEPARIAIVSVWLNVEEVLNLEHSKNDMEPYTARVGYDYINNGRKLLSCTDSTAEPKGNRGDGVRSRYLG
jgi:hypothetical protein